MKITKSQKIYLSGLGIGLCALALDQAYGGTTPAAGIAAVFAPTPAAILGRPMDDVHANDPALSVFHDAVTARLVAVGTGRGSSADVRDAFAPSAVWVPVRTISHAEPVERAADFRRAHTLKAIVESGGGGQALIDGNLVAVGQSVDGLRLLSVGRLRAVFGDGSTRVELRLEGTESSAPRRGPESSR